MSIYGKWKNVWVWDLLHMLTVRDQGDTWKNEACMSNSFLDIAVVNLQCICKGKDSIIASSITHVWSKLLTWEFQHNTPHDQPCGL